LAAAAPTGKSDPAARQPTILVVEDEILIRLMIADALRSHGLFVVEAASADEAAAVLNSSASIDLLFTDVRTPGTLDGFALAARMRSLRPNLKVVVASGHALARDFPRSIDAFFSKPYDVGRVVLRIRDLLTGAER
jgi:CheY-like chemotaxis protein